MELDKFDRRRAGALDLLIFMVIINLIGWIYMSVDDRFLTFIAAILYYLCFSFLILKDLIGNSSLMKKTHGIKIVDNNSGNDVTPMRTVLRNSTLIILFPIEIYWAFIFPKRRIGDYLFNTRLISTDRLSFKESWDKTKSARIGSNMILPFVVAIIITVISYYILKLIIESL